MQAAKPRAPCLLVVLPAEPYLLLKVQDQFETPEAQRQVSVRWREKGSSDSGSEVSGSQFPHLFNAGMEISFLEITS